MVLGSAKVLRNDSGERVKVVKRISLDIMMRLHIMPSCKFTGQ